MITTHHPTGISRFWLPVAAAAALFLGNPPPLQGDEPTAPERAMQLVKAGHSDQALEFLRTHLGAHPSDSDARIRYGAILSWEKQYDEGRRQLQMVLEKNPANGDALAALVNLELWSDHPARAGELARASLAARPDDPEMLVKLARAERAQKRNREATAALRRALAIDPHDQAARDMKEGMREETRVWESAVTNTQEWFSDSRARWSEWQGQMARKHESGSVILRYSRADRFSMVGHQAEADIYQRAGEGRLVYLNGGYSYDATLYPRSRFGAELFQSIPGGWEASGGFRWLSFSGGINIATGSVSKYRGNWMYTLRGFFTPDAAGTSSTLRGGARRYFGRADDYLGVWASWGAAPTEIRNTQDLSILHARSFQVEYSKVLHRWMTVHARGGLAREEQVYNPHLLHGMLELSLYCRF